MGWGRTPTADLRVLIDGARRVPFTDQIRLDAQTLSRCSHDLAAMAAGEPSLVPAARALAELLAGARPVPLTAEVRVERLAIEAVWQTAAAAG